MAGISKAELIKRFDEVSAILEDADDAALTREEVIEKIRQAYEVLTEGSAESESSI